MQLAIEPGLFSTYFRTYWDDATESFQVEYLRERYMSTPILAQDVAMCACPNEWPHGTHISNRVRSYALLPVELDVTDAGNWGWISSPLNVVSLLAARICLTD